MTPSRAWQEPATDRHFEAAPFIGTHPAIRLMLERIEQIADSDANVLIRGEAGTGKEVIARLIHSASPRAGRAFVVPSLATGRSASDDAFILAQHGTLFLGEVGEIPLNLQERMVATLRERAVRPDGAGSDSVPLDVRIIAATQRDLDLMVQRSSFLADLYYAINIIPIDVPPLRSRREDIPLLVEHFMSKAKARALDAEVLEWLCAYEWPGNLRQLETTIDHLARVAKTRAITLDDLPPGLRADRSAAGAAAIVDLPPRGVDLRGLLSQVEERLIEQALERTGGNRNRAAELLGLNRTTLVEKLRRRGAA
jgi:DNA-binding NtrC family response regulator